MRRALRVDGMAWVMLAGLLCLGALVVTAISAEGGATAAAAPITQALDWQAALGLREPWRLWTCAWVHWSAAHLAVNLAGGAVVAFVGWRARLTATAAVAWCVAWPVTQVMMAAIGPERLAAAMPHYGGLSGVLHAGVVVLGLSLAWPIARTRPPVPAPPSRVDSVFAAARASTIEPSRITEGPWAMTEMGAHTPSASMPLDQPMPVVEERPLRERWIGVAIVAGTLAKVLLEAPWDLAPRPSTALDIAVAPIAHACGLAAGLLAWAGMRLVGRPAR